MGLPRYWIVELARRVPFGFRWLAIWLINRETDRVERQLRECMDGIAGLARAFKPRPLRAPHYEYAMYGNAYNQMADYLRPGAIIPYSNARERCYIQNQLAAQQ